VEFTGIAPPHDKKTGPILEGVNWWQFFVNVSQIRNLIKVFLQPRLVDVKKLYVTFVGISVIWLKDKGVLIVIGWYWHVVWLVQYPFGKIMCKVKN
jgi:hypothetical protein